MFVFVAQAYCKDSMMHKLVDNFVDKSFDWALKTAHVWPLDETHLQNTTLGMTKPMPEKWNYILQQNRGKAPWIPMLQKEDVVKPRSRVKFFAHSSSPFSGSIPMIPISSPLHSPSPFMGLRRQSRNPSIVARAAHVQDWQPALLAAASTAQESAQATANVKRAFQIQQALWTVAPLLLGSGADKAFLKHDDVVGLPIIVAGLIAMLAGDAISNAASYKAAAKAEAAAYDVSAVATKILVTGLQPGTGNPSRLGETKEAIKVAKMSAITAARAAIFGFEHNVITEEAEKEAAEAATKTSEAVKAAAKAAQVQDDQSAELLLP